MNKDDIRRRVRARKRLMSDVEMLLAAERVFRRVEQLAAFTVSQNILMYHSLPDELSTHAFLDKWHAEKRFFLPRVNGVNLDILPYERTSLRHGAFHIEEPSGNEIADPSEIELVIVPAMAYDRSCNRVGRGRGYYDRLLADTRAYKVGVAYDFQLVDSVEDVDSFDVPVDIVITESNTFVRHKHI